MEFYFDIGPASRPDLIDQLATGLDLRTELRSREKLSGLWKQTDKLRAQTTEDLLARRRKKSRITGILFLIVAVILLVPGLSSGGINGMTVGGIIALLAGISNLNTRTGTVPKKCRQMAQKLVEMRRTAPTAVIRFHEAGMSVNGGNPIAYDKLEGILELPALYLLFINNSAMFLTKDEGDEVDFAAFSDFLRARPNLSFRQVTL